jgi:uracil-DNA glycosylase
LDEILILNPDIIVTQGLQAKKAIEELVLNKSNMKKSYYVIDLNGKEVFWLHTIHPSNYGAFNKQYQKGKGWTRYSRIIYKWYCNNKKDILNLS